MARNITVSSVSKIKKQGLIENIKSHKLLYVLAIPVFLYYLLFHYGPMYGMLIAFQDFIPARGFFRSEWIGLINFKDFFTGMYFLRLMRNTLTINILQLIFGFPIPILFALLLNELTSNKFKKFTQTITYMPHFVSAIVVCGIVINFVSSKGIIPQTMYSLFGIEPKNLLTDPSMFRSIFVSMNIWQHFGWSSIIYLAALSGLDPQIFEAATIDGASRFKKVIYITFPGISPTIVILLIMRIGTLMSLGWEQIILLYSPNVYVTADVISTFVYRRGLIMYDYSYSAAVGIFNSVINMSLLVFANWLSKKVNETSLW